MDQAEFQAALKEQEERLRREFARQKPWWGDRFAAMKADPQTAGLAALAGFAAAKWGGSVIGFISKLV